MKNNTVDALENIFRVKCKTIQNTTLLGDLTHEQQIRLNCIVNRISYSLNAPFGTRVNVVFRGDNSQHLKEKLSTAPESIEDAKMLSLLFYFGDKAKNFYKHEDKKIANSRWMKSIEAESVESSKVMFNKIKKVLRNTKPEVVKFKNKNPNFASYFEGDNIDNFSDSICSDIKCRDYYLYFLHTAGNIGVGDKSFLVSTSRRYNVAQSFSGLPHNKRFIIYYIIPNPIADFAVCHSSALSTNMFKQKHGLPVYEGTSLYPNQYEVAVKGALFSHHMLGVMIEEDDKDDVFIANPHLFSEQNNLNAILKGLKFDQSCFEKEISDTGYFRGVGIRLDRTFSTIFST